MGAGGRSGRSGRGYMGKPSSAGLRLHAFLPGCALGVHHVAGRSPVIFTRGDGECAAIDELHRIINTGGHNAPPSQKKQP